MRPTIPPVRNLGRPAVTVLLIWLLGVNLRSIIFGLPPVLPQLRQDLGLSFAATGALSSVALGMLGLGSIPGAMLGTRLGAHTTVTVSALVLGAAAASRLLPPQLFWVFAGTLGLTACVALVQPSMPVLVRRWYPDAIPRVSSVYSNGILIGNVAGASVTPLVQQLFGWRSTFLMWAGIALLGGALWALLTPRDDRPAPQIRFLAAAREPRVWQITALFVFQNIAYFTVSTWLPFLLRGESAAYVSFALLCLNCFPLVPLLLLAFLPWNYAISTVFYLAAAVMTVTGALGLLLGLVELAWLLAFLVGLGCACPFVGVLALPPLVARDEMEVAAFTALAFAVGYFLSFGGPLLAGALADGSGQVTAAFWPALAAGILMAVVALFAPRRLARAARAVVPA
jgi:CP family cyanate transporter-like MFS transporter